VPVQF